MFIWWGPFCSSVRFLCCVYFGLNCLRSVSYACLSEMKCLFLMASSAFSSVVLYVVFHITPRDKNICYVHDKNDIPVINPRGCHSPSSEYFCTPLVY